MKQDVNTHALKSSYLETVADMVKDIKHGSVTIIVQDGKVIQIDKTEKHRIKN